MIKKFGYEADEYSWTLKGCHNGEKDIWALSGYAKYVLLCHYPYNSSKQLRENYISQQFISKAAARQPKAEPDPLIIHSFPWMIYQKKCLRSKQLALQLFLMH